MSEVKRKKIKITEPESGSLHFLYKTAFGRLLLKLLTCRFVSVIGGAYMNSRLSKHRIEPFIKSNSINIAEYEKNDYKSYNEFFTRKIKKENRPTDGRANAFISPCDSKLTAYKIDRNNRFLIKGSYYSVEELICDKTTADKYVGGYCLIFRLAVDDYHRYCYIDNGTQEKNIYIKGKLHTVQPIALSCCNIYKRNCREYTVLHTENFGDVVQVEVGALMVGKIKNLHENYRFTRGEEKGMFEFGGSTIVLIVSKNTVNIDEEILQNTENGYETVVKFGEKIGEKIIC